MRISLIVAFFLLCLSLPGLARAEDATTIESVLAASMQTQAAPEQAPPKVFSQADPRWSKERIGSRSVREIGCLIMSLTMAAVNSGRQFDPEEVIEIVRRRHLVNSRGDLSTLSLIAALELEQFTRLYDIGARAADLAKEYIDSGKTIVLEVIRNGRSHWVYVLGVTSEGLMIGDPSGGKSVLLSSIYDPNKVKDMIVLSR